MNLREARQVIDSLDTNPDALSAFGDKYETADGSTVIPVSKPVGVFVIKDGKPTWEAATDDTRIALFGILVGLVATILACAAMIRRPPWPDLHGTVTKRI
jgi:hypothetical protein